MSKEKEMNQEENIETNQEHKEKVEDILEKAKQKGGMTYGELAS